MFIETEDGVSRGFSSTPFVSVIYARSHATEIKFEIRIFLCSVKGLKVPTMARDQSVKVRNCGHGCIEWVVFSDVSIVRGCLGRSRAERVRYTGYRQYLFEKEKEEEDIPFKPSVVFKLS